MKVKAAKPKQYTIRGVPAEVDLALRQRARQRHVSLNRLVVEELTAATIGPRKYADFSDLVGGWRPDPEFKAALEAQRTIDEELWK